MAEMTDAELIGYCEIHCTSDRALFHSNHINRMLELAGHPEGYVHSVSEGFYSAHDEMQNLVDRARARIKAQGEKE